MTNMTGYERQGYIILYDDGNHSIEIERKKTLEEAKSVYEECIESGILELEEIDFIELCFFDDDADGLLHTILKQSSK